MHCFEVWCSAVQCGEMGREAKRSSVNANGLRIAAQRYAAHRDAAHRDAACRFRLAASLSANFNFKGDGFQ